jgi:hypothetical protein
MKDFDKIIDVMLTSCLRKKIIIFKIQLIISIFDELSNNKFIEEYN